MVELATRRRRRKLPSLPAPVESHKSGGRDLWTAPLERAPEDPQAELLRVLHEVLDPELPISVVDLGLIYGAKYDSGTVDLELTFTATACPCMDFIKTDLDDRLTREPWIDIVRIEEVWDPPWTTDRISERGRAKLRSLGVGG